MSAASGKLSTSSSPHLDAPTTDGTPYLPKHGPSTHPSLSDPEGNHNFPQNTTRPKSNFLTRLANVFLLRPFDMWAPLPDYYLEQRLTSHTDDLIRHDLYKVLIDAQDLRTQQWRIGYWTVAVSTLLCSWLYTAVREVADVLFVCVKALLRLHHRNRIHRNGNRNRDFQQQLSRTEDLVYTRGSLWCHSVVTKRFVMLLITSPHSFDAKLPSIRHRYARQRFHTRQHNK